ncbi:MAG: hypothetical protein WB791_05865, partial [Waddliaceae bacterium]
CWDVGFRYTDFCVSKKRKCGSKKGGGGFDANLVNSSENLSGELNHSGFDGWEYRGDKDFGNFHFDAQILDIELGSCCFFDCCCGKIRPFAGAKLAWIHEKFKTNNNFSNGMGFGGFGLNKNGSRHRFQGYGLYLGGEGCWELFECQLCNTCIPVSFVTRLSTGILHSRFRHKEKNHYGSYHDRDKREKECLFITVNELFAGIDFAYREFCDFNADLSIGYEVQSWQGWREFNSRSDITSLGFGGLVVRLGVEF